MNSVQLQAEAAAKAEMSQRLEAMQQELEAASSDRNTAVAEREAAEQQLAALNGQLQEAQAQLEAARAEGTEGLEGECPQQGSSVMAAPSAWPVPHQITSSATQASPDTCPTATAGAKKVSLLALEKVKKLQAEAKDLNEQVLPGKRACDGHSWAACSCSVCALFSVHLLCMSCSQPVFQCSRLVPVCSWRVPVRGWPSWRHARLSSRTRYNTFHIMNELLWGAVGRA